MDTVQAVVQAVYQGRHGDFAVATCDDVVGSITFALDPAVWSETGPPEAGAWVILTDLCRKQAGWRALKARHYRPADILLVGSSERGDSS